MVGPSSFGVLRRAGVASTRTTWSPSSARYLAAAGARAVLDQALAHPVAVATIVGTRLLGWPVRPSLIAAATLDRLLPVVTARHPAPAARFLRLWTLACRFRRRWPDSLGRAERALGHRISIGSTDTWADDGVPSPATGGGPIPPLARLPHRIEGTTVAWAIDLDPTIDPVGLGRDAEGLSLLDPRILSVEVERRSNGWEVVVDFDVEPPTLAIWRPEGGQMIASVTSPPLLQPLQAQHREHRQHRQHEEGRTHGHG